MIEGVDIAVRYSIFGYLIGEGFRNVFKNKKSTIASLVIMCATMFVFGIFFAVSQNVNHITKTIEEQQGMEVFILDEATAEQKEELKNKIESSSIISSVEIKSDTINALIKIADGINIITTIILVILVFISIFIITNTIKLTVHARRKEISIMKYVGATNGFIRWPFMVEGMLIGLISVLISLLILAFSYNAVITQIEQSLINNRLNIPLLTFPELFQTLLIVYLVLGIGIGALGSAISMKKYLEV